MMKYLKYWWGTCGFLCYFFIAIVCFSEPFLVSDSYLKDEQPTEFQIVSKSINITVPAEKHPNGTVKLRFDLADIPDGEHVFEIIAIDKIRGKKSEPTVMKLLKKGKEVTILPLPSPVIEPANKQRAPSRAIPGSIK
jgi:hypothetical protein